MIPVNYNGLLLHATLMQVPSATGSAPELKYMVQRPERPDLWFQVTPPAEIQALLAQHSSSSSAASTAKDDDFMFAPDNEGDESFMPEYEGKAITCEDAPPDEKESEVVRMLSSDSTSEQDIRAMLQERTVKDWLKFALEMKSVKHRTELVLRIWETLPREQLQTALAETPLLPLLQGAIQASPKGDWTVVQRVVSSGYGEIDPQHKPKCEGTIGRGAFGSVSIAKWVPPVAASGSSTNEEQVVAVKEIMYLVHSGEIGSTTTEEILNPKKIQREVLLMAVLSLLPESHLIRFFGFYLESLSCCIVMELGKINLKQLVLSSARRRRQLQQQHAEENAEENSSSKKEQVRLLELKDKINIASQVALALHTLHSVRIVHRDLKNENILVVSSSDNPNIQVKLMDFGISRAESVSSTIVSGTISWAAPELFDAEKGAHIHVQPSSDVFSFGYLMWSLLVEREPHVQHLASKERIIQSVKKHPDCPLDIPAVEDSQDPVLANAGTQFRNLIRQCWRTNPTQRPSMRDVHSALMNLLHTLP